jgi:outer membrane lipoprotein LolB
MTRPAISSTKRPSSTLKTARCCAPREIQSMSVSLIRPLLLAAAALALTACTSVGTQKIPAPAVVEVVSAEAAQAEAARVAALQAQPNWALQAGSRVSKGKDGGSGRIDWKQDGRRYGLSEAAR